MVKGSPKTFYRSAFLAFLLLVFLQAIGQGFFFYRFVKQSGIEISQLLYWDVAGNLAKKLQPLLEEGIDTNTLKGPLEEFLQYNPRVDIYLIAKRGRVEYMFPMTRPGGAPRVHRRRIDVAPIEAFLAASRDAELPIWGENPLTRKKKTSFSAANVSIGGEPGYLYLVYFGHHFHQLLRHRAQSYAIFVTLLTVSVIFNLSLVLIGGVLYFFLVRRFYKIVNTVHLVAQGDLDQRIQMQGRDEVSQLAQHINYMADTIQSNVDILEKNDRLRREMIAHVTHDLNGPLSSTYGYLHRLLDGHQQFDKDTREQHLRIALNNLTLVTTLVSELFELSKLEAKDIEPEPEPFSLLDVVTEEVVPKYQPLAEKHGCTIEVSHPEFVPMVYADVGMIERVLSNLVENAIRYNRPGGSVQIKIEAGKEKIRVEVLDQGEGIPEEDLSRVFEQFYRVDKARSKKVGGSGLGLTIAKKILEAHAEEIRVESTLGVGTVFSFEIPIARKDLSKSGTVDTMENQD